MRGLLVTLALVLAPGALAQWDDRLLRPFTVDHRAGAAPAADVSFLLDVPAGKGGFIRIQGGHFVKPDGHRIRFWGVHFTDWSRGSVEIPPQEDASLWAATLARHGINLVRLHFLDLPAPRGIIDATGADTRSFDARQLDRLDFEIAEFKRRGIYVDLNLNVGRSYKAGDNVRDFDKIQWGKGLTLFDPQLIELEKEYAWKLFAHVNPYTGKAYRDETAIALVEIVNENGLAPGFRAPTPYYQEELTALYHAWLKRTRNAAPIALLKSEEMASAPAERYRTETAFFMALEDAFYQEMSRYLKSTLGVQVPITGTADHDHAHSPYPMLASLAKLDTVDGHVYWQHPGSPPPVNTPMVDDPAHSTVAQLARTAFAGKPYTVSEFNHPFPNEWASEGIPTLAAYGCLQDWDAIVLYTFEPKLAKDAPAYVGDPFDISLDPVRMAQMATGALVFLRGDVRAARRTVTRTYSTEETLDSRRLPPSEAPFFTPGFSAALALEHAVRIESLASAPKRPRTAVNPASAVSDTRELTWNSLPAGAGTITILTPRTEAIIGFLGAQFVALRTMAAQMSTHFGALVLSSLDGKPLAHSDRMLLTAGSRVANTGMVWNDDRTGLRQQGHAPTLIEPVRGLLALRHLAGAKGVSMSPLDGAGRPIGEPVNARLTVRGWELTLGATPTTWYAIAVQR